MASAKQRTRVSDLFGEVRMAVGDRVPSDWLAGLEREALAVRAGWQDRFDAYLRGLAQCGAIDAAQEARWRAECARCKSQRSEQLTFVFLWTVLVSLSTAASQSLSIETWDAVVAGLSLAAFGVFWSGRTSSRRLHRTPRGLPVLGFAAAAAVLGMAVPATVAGLVNGIMYAGFERQQQEFAKDGNGFAWLRQFAQREYGVPVVLSSTEEAWPRTSLNLAGSSPAYMIPGAAWCEFGMSRSSMRNHFGTADGEHGAAWEKGIMMHELAHCLDVRRDLAGVGGAIGGTDAIAPADRARVDGPESYFRISVDAASTRLWQEAVADIVAVGYWRINETEAVAGQLSRHLQARRTALTGRDPSHATACWIDAAMNAPPPERNAALFGWADRLRSSAVCKLPDLAG